MATSPSALPQLEFLNVEFKSPTPQSKRRNRHVPPPTRFVLPALTWLTFKGVSEYLDLPTARIDAPLIEHFDVTFFHQLVFDIPQIIRFLGHQDAFRPSSLTLYYNLSHTTIFLSTPMCYPTRFCNWSQVILCKSLDWQAFSTVHICSQILSFRSSVESLNIRCFPRWHADSSPEDEIDPTLWLQLFRCFTSVQSLEIHEPLIAAALTGQPLVTDPFHSGEYEYVRRSRAASHTIIRRSPPTLWSSCNCNSLARIYLRTLYGPRTCCS
jgi:hypothetical protein